MLSDGDGNFTGTGLVRDTFLVGMHIMPFLFMGLVWNSWSTRAAAHSRNVSVSYRQMGPCQQQPACFRESNLIPNPTTASRSCCLTQPALPVRLQTRLYRAAIRQAAVVCIQEARDPFLSFISQLIYFPSPNIPFCACCSAIHHQPHNHKACPQWLPWHCASRPACSL